MRSTHRAAALACSVVGLVVGLLLGFGPTRFQSTPSLQYIRQAGLPWPVWGVLFLAYSALLLTAAIRGLPGQLGTMSIGWWFGAALYGCFVLSLLNAISTSGVGVNPPITGGAIGFVVFHVIIAISTQRADVPQRG